MKITVGKRLGIGFGVVLLILAISGVTTVTLLGVIDKNRHKIVEVEEPTSDAAYEMEINLIGTGFGLLGYFNDRDPLHLERIEKDVDDFTRHHKKYLGLAWEDERAFGVMLGKMYTEYKDLAYKLIALEDEQDKKIATFIKKHQEMDDVLDEKMQASIKLSEYQSHEKLEAVMELEININEIDWKLGERLRTHQAYYDKEIKKDEGHFRKFFKLYKSLELTSEEKGWTQQLGLLFDDTIKLSQEIIELDTEMTKGLKEFVRIRREMDVLLDDEIQVISDRYLSEANARVERSIVIAIALCASLFFLGIIAGTGVAVSISRGITGPIRKLTNAAKDVAGGNLSTRVEVKTKDEIGELADSFNKMAIDLKTSKDKIESYSANLEKAVQGRTAELEKTKAGLEKAVKERTAEVEKSKTILEEKVDELEIFYDATVDRELGMEELRNKVKELEDRSKEKR